MDDRPIGLDIFRTALGMRHFEHAAAARQAAEAVIVRMRTEAGRTGWGETLPRPYVTGETLEGVVDDIEKIFWPRLRDCRSDEQLLHAVTDLPCEHAGRAVTAARCAVELAAVQALELSWSGFAARFPAAGRERRVSNVPVTGVLGSSDPGKTARTLRRMRWYGLRHFKLKVGLGEQVDQANLRAVHKQLSRRLARGRCTLRVDANGAWKYEEVVQRVESLKAFGVHAVEQPCTARAPRFADLAMDCPLPLIADESCITAEDANVLLGAEGRVWLNVRLSKNGGLMPAMALAAKAVADGVPYVLGCMVGESGILSTAQRVFLTAAPRPVAVEGNYGRFLLTDDLTEPSPGFGYGGRLLLPPGLLP